MPNAEKCLGAAIMSLTRPAVSPEARQHDRDAAARPVVHKLVTVAPNKPVSDVEATAAVRRERRDQFLHSKEQRKRSVTLSNALVEVYDLGQ